jgi:predicted  nucleic acid-binding Zn-ribbon protein
MSELRILSEKMEDLESDLKYIEESAECYYDILQEKSFRFAHDRDVTIRKEMSKYARKAEGIQEEIEDLRQAILTIMPDYFNFN